MQRYPQAAATVAQALLFLIGSLFLLGCDAKSEEAVPMFDERLLTEPISRSTENQVDPLIYDEGMSLGGVGTQRSYGDTSSPFSDSTRLGSDEPGAPLAFPEGINDTHDSGLPGDLGGMGLPELGGVGARNLIGSGADDSFSLPMDDPSSQGQ